MEITILGCGCSMGVPIIGCKCTVCKSNDPKNKRLRSSIMVRHENKNILIDTGPDLRQQLLRIGSPEIDYVILTHQHYDHISGLNELRGYQIAKFVSQFNGLVDKIYSFAKNIIRPIQVYTTKDVYEYLKISYSYMFSQDFTQIQLKFNIIDFYGKIPLPTPVQFFLQYHALQINNLGVRIGNFVYANDVISLPEESEVYLENLDVLILDCKKYTNTEIHLGLKGVLEWNQKYKPKKIYLTNLSHDIEYYNISAELANSNIEPCFDGMVIRRL